MKGLLRSFAFTFSLTECQSIRPWLIVKYKECSDIHTKFGGDGCASIELVGGNLAVHGRQARESFIFGQITNTIAGILVLVER